LKFSRLAFLMGIGAIAAAASPISYALNFSAIGGSPFLITPTGSFTYDASLAVGAQFSNFFIQWDGLTENFTSAANGPIHFDAGAGCPATPTSVNFFNFLNGIPQCTPDEGTIQYSFSTDPSIFEVCDSTTTGYVSPCASNNAVGAQMDAGDSSHSTGTASVGDAFGDGTFTITASAPEPSTIAMSLAGLGVLLAHAARRRR
jgi:hypothetical protein